MKTKTVKQERKSLENKKKKNKVGTIVAISLVGGVFVLLAVLYGISMSNLNSTRRTLEFTYQKNFYDLVDNINNTELKLSKVIASGGESGYSKKLLNQVSINTSSAANNVSSLPYSINGLSETIIFINQMSGYSTSLCQRLDSGEELTDDDKKTLQEIYSSVTKLKANLNDISSKLYNGYSITNNSISMEGDYNSFTTALSTNSSQIEYPTMIYDGPFADSLINAEIKGLEGNEVSMETAKENATKILDNIRENDIEYLGETKGKFTTYDFSGKTTDGTSLYFQMTKKEGKLLTISGFNNSITNNITIDSAITIAKEFAKKSGLEDMEEVWNDTVSGCAYINLAPVKNNTILYPDLVKIKVDLSSGQVIGYEAREYFTNHTQRTIETATFDATQARSKISSDFKIEHQKLALAPLDYNRQVLCYEFKCTKMGATYYIYLNANLGNYENVLKVIETSSNGSLLA